MHSIEMICQCYFQFGVNQGEEEEEAISNRKLYTCEIRLSIADKCIQ